MRQQPTRTKLVGGAAHDPVNFLEVLHNEPNVVERDKSRGPVFQTEVHLAIVEELTFCDAGGLNHRRRCPKTDGQAPRARQQVVVTAMRRSIKLVDTELPRCAPGKATQSDKYQGGPCDETRPAYQQWKSRSDWPLQHLRSETGDLVFFFFWTKEHMQ